MERNSDLALKKISSRILAGKGFIVKTPVCREYAEKVVEWLVAGGHGAIVYGLPRLGKTSATRWVLDSLAALVGGPVPYLEVPAREQFRISEREFFEHILSQMKHRHASHGTAGDKRERLKQALVSRASRSLLNTFILFVDEAHLLKDIHFRWLLNVGNEMDAARCRLFCLFIGQEELTVKKAELLQTRQNQIVGRYMVNEFLFQGIRSQGELGECLSGFDGTVYPPGSNQKFNSIFLPRAVLETGFSLADHQEAIWEAFLSCHGAKDVLFRFGLPMHYLTAFVLLLLNNLSRSDPPSAIQVKIAISESIVGCGFSDAASAIKEYLPAG